MHAQDHIFLCAKNKKIMQQGLNELITQLRSIKTPTHLIQCIIHSLIAYYNDRPIPTTHITVKFIDSQNKIGWDHFICGRIAKNIDHIIDIEYKNKKPTPYFKTKKWKQQMYRIISHYHIKL